MNDPLTKLCGPVALYRSLLYHPIWTREVFNRGAAWVDLILLANQQESTFLVRGNVVTVERGDVGHSQLSLGERWRWGRDKVASFLRELAAEGMITLKTTNLTTIITINNYRQYQTAIQTDSYPAAEPTTETAAEQEAEPTADTTTEPAQKGKGNRKGNSCACARGEENPNPEPVPVPAKSPPQNSWQADPPADSELADFCQAYPGDMAMAIPAHPIPLAWASEWYRARLPRAGFAWRHWQRCLRMDYAAQYRANGGAVPPTAAPSTNESKRPAWAIEKDLDAKWEEIVEGWHAVKVRYSNPDENRGELDMEMKRVWGKMKALRETFEKRGLAMPEYPEID
jgi:hypothetical protein